MARMVWSFSAFSIMASAPLVSTWKSPFSSFGTSGDSSSHS
jgi:hypothetical protein